MPKKNMTLATSENVNNATDEKIIESSATLPEKKDDDDLVPIQAEKPQKVKRPQTEAQKANTAKMKAALAAKWDKSRAEKIAAEEEYKKKVEERVVKKAIAIKKREVKKQIVLDEISSDDEPIEEIIPKMRKVIARQPQIPQVPKIIFM